MIGMKCSQRGVNVRDCPDYRLTFSSYFPTLKLHMVEDVMITDTSVTQTICTHNLGYIPAFWVFTDRMYPVDMGLGHYRLSSPGTSQYLAVDNNNLIWRSGAGAGSLGVRVHIFALDITKPYRSDSEKSSISDKKGGTDEYGIQVIKNSPPLQDKDYSLNSKNRYPLIHEVGQAVNESAVVVKHNLGYAPMYFVWAKVHADGRYQSISMSSGAVATANELTLRYTIADPGVSSYIIFNDPIMS